MKTHTRITSQAAICGIGLVILAALSGCGTDQKELQAFLAETHTPVGSSEYRVMPPDVLTISARPAEEYKGLIVRLGPDGKAFLPLLGEYQLANKTTTEIAAELTDDLCEYYQDVQVTVQVRRYNSQKFYVFGQVSHPGAYTYTGSDSLLSALARAQPTSLAMPEKIKLIRARDPAQGGFVPSVDANGDINVDAQKLTVNLWNMVRKGDMSANVLLANNDVIYVPANPLAQVGLVLQSLLFPIRPGLETANVPNQALTVATGSP